MCILFIRPLLKRRFQFRQAQIAYESARKCSVQEVHEHHNEGQGCDKAIGRRNKFEEEVYYSTYIPQVNAELIFSLRTYEIKLREKLERIKTIKYIRSILTIPI